MAKPAKTVVIDGVARRVAEPKKPSAVRYVTLPDDPPEELFEFQGEPQAAQYMDAALQGVMAELGERDTDSKVTVKRRTVTNGVPLEAWLFECHPAAFSIPDLQAHYGAGEYRITVYGKQEGSNYKVIHADKKLVIGDAPGGPKKPEGFGALPAAAPAIDVRRDIAEAVAAPFNALAQLLAQTLPKASSRADTFAEMKQLAELFALMRGPAAPSADPMEMLTRAVTLMQRAAPAASAAPLTEDGDLSPNYVLGKAIELVQSLMSAHNKGGAPAPAQLAAPAATPVPAAALPGGAPVATADSEEIEKMKLALKMQLAFLLNAARSDSETSLYSGLIFEQAPDEIMDALVSEKWWEALIALEPEFAPFKPWAEKVRGEVIAALEEDEKAAALTPPAEPGKTAGDASAPPAPVVSVVPGAR